MTLGDCEFNVSPPNGTRNLFPSRLNRKKNECLRALEIMFELFRCRFYNRNKNASLLNGIERFSGSKRILRNEYFFSLK